MTYGVDAEHRIDSAGATVLVGQTMRIPRAVSRGSSIRTPVRSVVPVLTTVKE